MARSIYTPISLGLLTFGLLTSTSLVNPARADTAVAQTDWAINRVASVASGSYCTMAQKYSDNTIVTFAKNKAGEYSVAFDFVKPQFPSSTATTVSLRPGNGSAQTFSVAPQSDKVVVISLGTNDSFLQAVKSTAKIDLETSGKSHSFNTSKFAAAADELSDCTGGMKNSAMASLKQAPPEVASIAPAAGKEVQAPAPEPTKTASLSGVTPSAAQLIAQPSTSGVVSHPDTKDVPRMAAAAAPVPAVSAPSNQVDVARIQAENAQLKQALAEARKNFDRMDSLQRENESLKAQSTASTNLSAELQKIKTDLSAAQSQNQALQVQASQAAQAQQANAATTQQIAQLQKQNADMKAQLDASNTAMGQLQAKSVQSEASAQQLAELQKQNAAMKLQVDAATTTISQLQTKSAEATAAATQLATLQKQNADMKAQLDTANATVGQLQAKSIQSASAAEQVAALQKQTAEMKVQLEAANKTAADLQSKNNQATAANSQLADLQKQNADMKIQLAAATTTISQLQAKSAQSAVASEQVSTLQKKLETSNQTIAQLQAKTAQSAAAAEQMASLQKQLETSNQTIAQLQAKTAQSAVASEQVATLQKQLETSNQTIAQLQAKAAQTPAVDPAAAANLQTAQQENAALKQQIAALQTKAAQAPAIDPNAASNLQAAQQENAALKQQIEALQTKVAQAAPSDNNSKQLQDQLQAATQENNVLKTQIAAMQTSGGSQSAATGSNWDLEQATKRYQESQREIQRLASKIQEQQKQFDQEKEHLKEKLFDPAVADQAQRDRLNELEQQIADMQAGKPVSQNMASIDAPISSKAVPVPAVVKAPEQVASIAPAAGTPANGRQEVEDLPVPAIRMPVNISSKPEIATAPAASAVISLPVSVKFQSREDYERMIKSAGINIRGPVEEVAGGNSDTYRGYRWKTDSLYGSSEQRAMKSGKEFDKAVNEYLARAKSRCTGDFAAIPSEVSISADKVKSFEIACIGGKENTSASVVFTYGNDVITTLAHEGKSEAMNLAMEARDRMVGQMGSIKTAAK